MSMTCSGRMPGISRLGERCCGCGACAAACPHGCIHMAADVCGFEHPSVNSLQCARCGGCERVCPVINSPDIPNDACYSAWWMYARDASVVSTSSSGGVFGLLASSVLSEGGLVCGAAMEGSCPRVSHVLVGDTQSLGAVIGSKYVQSTISARVYEQVAKALCGGSEVLFSGCGCQVAAMRAYLAAKHVPFDGFLGVEVICHGVPAPTLWGAWMAYVAAQMGEPIAHVNFRDKATGWEAYSVTYEGVMGGRLSQSHEDDWYMKAFLHNASIRSSCLICPFKRHSGSDVLLGDFWGVGALYQAGDSAEGVNAVVVNTSAGLAALESIKGEVLCGGTDLESIARGNPSMMAPTSPHRQRSAFLEAVARGAPIGEMVHAWPFRHGIAGWATALLRFLARK